MKSKILQTIEYELVSNLEVLKKYDTWLYVVSILALIFFISGSHLLAIVCLLLIIVINMKRHYSLGDVTAYFRRKNLIPSEADIQKYNKEIRGVG